MHIRIINGVSQGTLGILKKRIINQEIKELIEQNKVTTVGLCQGELLDMLVASDIAEKASNVTVAEISGICPQHVVCIGIFGDTTSVKDALKAVEKGLK